MQTFLPYPEFERSAATLDQKRLGKQRVETLQILLWLHGVQMTEWDPDTNTGILLPRKSGWSHPAAGMWAGHEHKLMQYQEAVCAEWIGRGYRDTCLPKSRFIVNTIALNDCTQPEWLGDEYLHMTHRSNLVWKDREHYGPLFPEEVPEHPEDPTQYWEYWWPKGGAPLKQRIEDSYLRACEVLESEKRP